MKETKKQRVCFFAPYKLNFQLDLYRINDENMKL
ncbi:hypothetical protein I656_00684 [Geobacillus sp. WSUCF1]|nr:hypothetical protein I656_00684 [Geobacillus sp. WSUCF1]